VSTNGTTKLRWTRAEDGSTSERPFRCRAVPSTREGSANPSTGGVNCTVCGQNEGCKHSGLLYGARSARPRVVRRVRAYSVSFYIYTTVYEHTVCHSIYTTVYEHTVCHSIYTTTSTYTCSVSGYELCSPVQRSIGSLSYTVRTSTRAALARTPHLSVDDAIPNAVQRKINCRHRRRAARTG
jgi:hypothetical protein